MAARTLLSFSGPQLLGGNVIVPANADAYVFNQGIIQPGSAQKLRIWFLAAGIGALNAAGGLALSVLNADLFAMMVSSAGADIGVAIELPRHQVIGPLSNQLQQMLELAAGGDFVDLFLSDFGPVPGGSAISVGGEWAVRNSTAAPQTASPSLLAVVYELL